MKIYFNEVSKSILDIKLDKRTECFNFGLDNAYPSLIKALVSMSVTSKNCVDRVAKATYGKSFGEIGNVIINSSGQSLNELLRISAREYAEQNNLYIQISYDANLDIKSIVDIPGNEVRVGKADDKGYSGKFIIYDNWDKQKKKKFDTNDFELYDRYNPSKLVIEKQIRAAAKAKDKSRESLPIVDIISDYNGQILHLKKDDGLIYSLSDLEPVKEDSLLEANSKTFRSRGASKGFLNTKLLTVQPFANDDERDEFKQDLKDLQGAENSGDVLLLETSQMSDDLSKQIQLNDLSGTYNDKLFEYSDSQAEKNICKAFTVPLMLVSQTDNSLFGSSGEMLKEAKLQLWENKEEERDQLEEVFSGLMAKFQENKRITERLKVKNPYTDEEEEKANRNINKQAQAQLRGTAAGVQGIIELAKAVKENTLDRDNAVAIVRNIYGFSQKQAEQMIGGFDGQDPDVIEQTNIIQNG